MGLPAKPLLALQLPACPAPERNPGGPAQLASGTEQRRRNEKGKVWTVRHTLSVDACKLPWLSRRCRPSPPLAYPSWLPSTVLVLRTPYIRSSRWRGARPGWNGIVGHKLHPVDVQRRRSVVQRGRALCFDPTCSGARQAPLTRSGLGRLLGLLGPSTPSAASRVAACTHFWQKRTPRPPWPVMPRLRNQRAGCQS